MGVGSFMDSFSARETRKLNLGPQKGCQISYCLAGLEFWVLGGLFKRPV